VSLSFRQVTYLAAIAVAIAALVFAILRNDQDRFAPGESPPAPAMESGKSEASSSVPTESGLTIDDRPVFPDETEFVRVVNPGGEDPHTIRNEEGNERTMSAPLERALKGAAARSGSAAEVSVGPGSSGVRIAGGAIEPGDGGPGGSEFHEPGMPPEYGAPSSDASDEDMRGSDIVVVSPEADNPQVPDIPPEDLNPGTNYPAPEDGDPGIDYPAPEDSGT
jgi:hypothetical protein